MVGLEGGYWLLVDGDDEMVLLIETGWDQQEVKLYLYPSLPLHRLLSV